MGLGWSLPLPGATPTAHGYAAMASNQIPSNLTKGTGSILSAIIFGNFSDLIVGS